MSNQAMKRHGGNFNTKCKRTEASLKRLHYIAMQFEGAAAFGRQHIADDEWISGFEEFWVVRAGQVEPRGC